MGAIAFEEKTKFKPLQAADQLAYEICHYLSDRRARVTRPILDKFLRWPQLSGTYFDEDGLLSFIGELRKAGKI